MNFQKIKRVLWFTLGLNIVVAISKIALGILTGTISILSDGIHSGFDSLTNIVGLIGIKFAERPADKDHPYGHRKYEAIASQIIFTFLVIAGWKIGENVFEKISNPAIIHTDIPWLTFLVLVCCMIIDAVVAWYESKKGRELKSTILTADSKHTKSHYATTGAVILGTLGIKIGLPPIIDPIAACVVIVFIGKLAFDIFKETSSILSDKALVDIKKIKKLVESVGGIKSCHQIRSRGDEDHIFLDIHIIIAPNLSLETAHEICHEISGKIQEQIPEIKDVTVHPEPR